MEELDGHPGMKTASAPQRLAWVSVAGVVYYVVAVAALHVVEPSFDPLENFISDYANGRYPWLVTSTFVALALSLSAINLALKPTFPRVRLTIIGRGFLWAGVLGVVGAGLFPADPVDPPETVNGMLHVVAGLVAFPSLCIGLVCLSYAAARSAAWRRSGWALLILAVLFVATFGGIMALLFDRGLGGLGQRLLFVWLIAWVIVTAHHMVSGAEPDVGGTSSGAA